MATALHIPVLLQEVLDQLSPQDNKIYVDATFGLGGYSKSILDAAKCNVIGIDRDPDAIARGQDLVKKYNGRLKLIHGRFSAIDSLISQPVDGVVFDLGVSSPQLDEGIRGFSFMQDGPLDMRMGQDGMSAADIINTASETDLADIIFHYGEERLARRIAKKIVNTRTISPITTTKQLSNLVAEVVPRQKHGINPATRTFQAFRIKVNDELTEVEVGLKAAFNRLKPSGRLVVVSFHSLEDRIVKNFFNDLSGKKVSHSRHVPVTEAMTKTMFKVLTKKPVAPSDTECAKNPRARSAKLRAGEKLAGEN